MQITKVTPEHLEAYNSEISREVLRAYSIAERMRRQGKDVTDIVEIPLAVDMADRIEELIQIPGLAERIRSRKDRSREELSLEISVEVARELKEKDERLALDKAVRVGLAILTEGILVAPLEGIASVDIVRDDEHSYASISYSGPIRGAGGTAQALSVLIADIVRRELGVGEFVPEDAEVERYIEEIQSYNRIKHLQYLPSPEEIRKVVQNSPIFIDGEGSEEEEVSGHRDMKRITTNRIRGGMCLVICEGLIQKASKILKYTTSMGMKEWEFLSAFGKGIEKDTADTSKSEKFLKDIIAGRPVFSHPGRPGGFRLRYGRSRVSGLAAASIHPASMVVLGGFIAIGTQLKIELPGKAAAMTACDTIDGPTVMLDDGSHERIRTEERSREVLDRIVSITDLGDILISYGEFLENNYRLKEGAFGTERWNRMALEFTDKYVDSIPDQYESVELSRKYGLPLHPEYDLLYHDAGIEELKCLRGAILGSDITNGNLLVPADQKDTLVKINMEFSVEGNSLKLPWFYPLAVCLGLDVENGRIVESREIGGDHASSIEMVNSLSGIRIIPRAPTRIGARMGRPEKAGDRKMKPKVHALFPVESYGDARRSIMGAGKKKGEYLAEFLPRYCPNCDNITPVPLCEKCGTPTRARDVPSKNQIDLRTIISKAETRIGIIPTEKTEVKGVKKLMSAQKVCEPLEKGIARAYYDISVNKDGTCRYDVTDVTLTHFTTEEISMSGEVARKLGYEPDHVNEIFAQDVIIPEDAGDYLLRVSKYIDHLLIYYYGAEPFYSCKTRDDLIGSLVIGLAPHTSGGIVGRIIGFTKASACYAHPFFHAAKRRNCDGDEDSVMLLLDGLLNFSRHFLPYTRGGLMDAPLVITTKLNPEEVDKEALNVDTLSSYPEEFYEECIKGTTPSEIQDIMKPVSVFMSDHGTYCGMGYSFEVSDINQGITLSAYKSIGTMSEKIEKQLNLARSIRAVDADDVASRVLESHFLPDIYGNFRGFFTQTFRCSKCSAKYRRVPLSGKCRSCGSESIILTVHKGGIVKYLEETRKVLASFELPEYLRSRIENLMRTIDGTFTQEEQHLSLIDYVRE
ncbi:MAG: DNA polymerase II large subunit [Candidatus Thermoplasmatota archaeon]|nr:DNA polymerase II large subunit [Candidatus Thermoplasmatota archaeon]